MNDIQFDQKTYRKLTPREVEIAKMASNGLCSKEIGGILGITLKTVEVHRHNLLKKMKCSSTIHAVATLIRGGII